MDEKLVVCLRDEFQWFRPILLEFMPLEKGTDRAEPKSQFHSEIMVHYRFSTHRTSSPKSTVFKTNFLRLNAQPITWQQLSAWSILFPRWPNDHPKHSIICYFRSFTRVINYINSHLNHRNDSLYDSEPLSLNSR